MESGALIADRFEVQRLAGEGGMGSVWRARDRRTEATVALKMLHAAGPRALERFDREASILGGLRHPAIVRYIAHGTTVEGRAWLAMEWLDGEDLSARLGREGLTTAEALALGERIADALAEAHRNQIIHRDVKPSNVFLVGNDIARAKILDFGIARSAASARSVTQTGVVVGTPGYMAPEQARGLRDLDARVDVFSLGCVFFECLTGRAVFQGEHVISLLAKILLEEAPRVTSLRPGVPESVSTLVADMLSKDASRRPADGGAVVQAMRALGTLEAEVESHRAPVQKPREALTAREQRFVCVVLARMKHTMPIDVGTIAVAADTGATDDAEHLDALRRVLAAHRARVERLADGTYMVVLTGTGAATDQAVRAARCALAVRRLLPDAAMALATGRAEMTGPWPAGEAIDQGVALVTRAGAQEGVTLDTVTAGLLDARFEVRNVQSALVLVSERDALQTVRTVLGKRTSCVGRDREIGLLVAMFDQSIESSSSCVALVTGTAGVGKSRLGQEFVRRVVETHESGVEVFIGRGDPVSSGSPFGIVSSALLRCMALAETDGIELRQKAVAARIARLVRPEDAQRVTQFVGEIVGASFPIEGRPQLAAARADPRLMSDQIGRAFADWLEAECRVRPCLFVLEDLHWGDAASVRIIDGALRALADLPMMVLALSRPEVRDIFPSLWTERNLTEVRLSELSRKASEQLIRDVLGTDLAKTQIDQIVSRASGNAFYLEELIRAVSEGHGEALPATVIAMVQSRLEGLDVESRRVLRGASVFGQSFSEEGVRALLGGEHATDVTAEALTTLIDREVIVRGESHKYAGRAQFAFRHAIVRDAAYGMLTDADRALGHRLAGEWLEQNAARDAIAIADHFERAGEAPRAAEWFRRAAHQARDGNDLAGVIARAERAIVCGAKGEELGDLLCLQAEAAHYRGELQDAKRRARDAMDLLEQGSDRWFDATEIAVTATARGGDTPSAHALALQVHSFLVNAGVSDRRLRAAAHIACTLLWALDFDAGGAMLDIVAAAIERGADASMVTRGLIERAYSWRAHFEGDLGTSLEREEAAAMHFRNAGDLRSACGALLGAGSERIILGLYAEAVESLKLTIVEAEKLGLWQIVATAKQNLAAAHDRLGGFEEALTLTHEAIRLGEEQRNNLLLLGASTYFVPILFHQGDLAGAEKVARHAMERFGKAGSLRPVLLGWLTYVLLAQQRPQDAARVGQAAMDEIAELGAIEEGEAIVRAAHAEALYAVGAHAEAREAIRAARTLVLNYADRIRNPQWRASFLENVAENARIVALAREWLGE